jgi:hypothetical protein
MINNDRIVPITKIDYLSLIYVILSGRGSIGVLKVVDGVASVPSASQFTQLLVNEPVKKIELVTGSKPLIFVASHDFEGITLNGEAVNVDTEIKNDGVSLYGVFQAEGQVDVEAMTPEVD